jgi:hypothetical protein
MVQLFCSRRFTQRNFQNTLTNVRGQHSVCKDLKFSLAKHFVSRISNQQI